MRHLLNTLFVLTPDTYLSLENENVVVNLEENIIGRFPLHTLEQICYFGYKGASPALMGKCAIYKIGLSFFTPNGRFLAKIAGEVQGNVLLRKEQYRISDDLNRSCQLARNFITGKILNSRSCIERIRRDHALIVNNEVLRVASGRLLHLGKLAKVCEDMEALRGHEGEAASIYFAVFNQLILQNKVFFAFNGRIKRPPTDPVNALLSFVYTILANDCASALSGVGLDPYVGFMHRDRPGRKSLALDLMEEFRSIYADRFVLYLINNRILSDKSFEVQENSSVLLSDSARKNVLSEWQERKKDIITHPFLEEKLPWGLLPHIQATILARCIRGDLEEYPAYLWK